MTLEDMDLPPLAAQTHIQKVSVGFKVITGVSWIIMIIFIQNVMLPTVMAARTYISVEIRGFVMEEGDLWEDLDNDISVKILQSFDVLELSAGLAHVCKAWRLACCDQLPLKKLDLSVLKSNFIKNIHFFVEKSVFDYENSKSNLKLYFKLETTYNLCPWLKRLVMLSWNKMKKQTICRALHICKDLESLTMPSIAHVI
uniref:F-box domain-containing protein n=1 Tax=Solanum lycopersicum TaxID=4081 RepID=A0A3Q7FMD8_SOLLC